MTPSRVSRRLRAALKRVRLDPRVTRWLGPRHRRSRTRVELDITWACNLRCFHCNRSCEQAPTGEGMTALQVTRFVDESLAAGQRWERIRVLGGEPTLHPELDAILAELLRYRASVPEARIELVTHGYGERTRAVLGRLPPGIEVENTGKTSPEQPFEGFNLAPADDPAWAGADFASGCSIPEVCGVGLGPYGWYPCAVAAGIDRIVGLDVGRPVLPDPSDTMEDQLRLLCRMCGHFQRAEVTAGSESARSPAWEEAYATWRERRPRLTPYG